MMGRWSMMLVVLCSLVAGCGDHGGPSDEELVEQFVRDVSGKVDDAYVSRALGYLEIARYPLDVRVPQLAGVYTEEREHEIVGQFKSGMRRYFYDSEIKLRSQRFEIEGDRAEVTLGLITAVGPLGASITLRKAAPGVWKVARVHVDR